MECRLATIHHQSTFHVTLRHQSITLAKDIHAQIFEIPDFFRTKVRKLPNLQFFKSIKVIL